jgi:hypothetical protein
MKSDRVVLLATADLLFRAKLDAVVQHAGWRSVRQGSAEIAVVELTGQTALDEVRRLVSGGATVLAFGPHVHHELLRDARTAGARAVPNSQIETVLARVLSDT